MAEVKNSNKPITLDLSETSRSKIWVNGDCTKVIELNLTDFNVMTRAKDALSKLDELQSEANKLASDEVLSSEEDSEAKFDELIEAFRSIDTSIIGCSMAPTFTSTTPSFTSHTGTCFSAEASTSPGMISSIIFPQHISGTLVCFTIAII